MRTKKRQMWMQVCILFAVLWTVLGLFIWPFLFLALCSALMILIPIGVTEDEKVVPQHDPEAWRRNAK
jgi:hypothetical protein